MHSSKLNVGKDAKFCITSLLLFPNVTYIKMEDKPLSCEYLMGGLSKLHNFINKKNLRNNLILYTHFQMWKVPVGNNITWQIRRYESYSSEIRSQLCWQHGQYFFVLSTSWETLATCRLWKNCLPQNWSLMPKRLWTAGECDIKEEVLSLLWSWKELCITVIKAPLWQWLFIAVSPAPRTVPGASRNKQ